MNIFDMIKGAPELSRGLQGLGLSDSKIGDLGREVGDQLGGGAGLDFSSLLSGLDAKSFLSKIDVGSLASRVGISSETAQGAMNLIAPKIAEFSGGASALGKIGGLGKGLFDK